MTEEEERGPSEGEKPTVPEAVPPANVQEVDDLLCQAEDLIEERCFNEARALLHSLLEAMPNSAEVYDLLGAAAWIEGKNEEAITYFERALELDPKFSDPRLGLIQLLLEMKRQPDALEQCDQGLALADTDEERVGFIQSKFEILFDEGAGDVEAAREILQMLPAGPYQDPDNSFRAACALLKAGDPTNAEAHLLDAAKLDPENPDIWRYLGLVREALGDVINSARYRLACLVRLESEPAPGGMPNYEEFVALIKNIIDSLPGEGGQILRQALVVTRDLPGAEAVAEGLDPFDYCLVHGLGDHIETASVRPARVYLYIRNIAFLFAREGRGQSLTDFLTKRLTEELIVNMIDEPLKNAAGQKPPTTP